MLRRRSKISSYVKKQISLASTSPRRDSDKRAQVSNVEERASLLQDAEHEGHPPKEILSRQMINKCLMDIQDSQPLKDKVEPEHILPIMKLFGCNKNKNKFKLGLKNSLLHELGFKAPKSEREIENEPFLLLGYGINSYFDILLSLCCLFIILFCFA
jgi:hypothetical protein